ncbi:hypothetical protein R1sor_001232 [Riccia sorocarpa]|uniref:AMP-activated protein kinase glycogen-binding domain-containing protein n=1 Tax=Riccia sorocarpa TaxID=122646 RepID=A0ABD3GYH8_9MARC
MAAVSKEFAFSTVSVACSLGKGTVGCRNASSMLGTERVTLGGVGTRDDNKNGMRLVWVACGNPTGSSSIPPKPSSKSRPRREGPSESDLKLARDLKEFISNFDLPPTEVPTTKELKRNGRQDLANLVRRRGYKTVAGLLGLAPEAEAARTHSVSLAKSSEAPSAAGYVSDNGAAGDSSRDAQQVSNRGENKILAPACDGGSGSFSPRISLDNIGKSNGFASYTGSDFRESSAGTQALAPGLLDRDFHQLGHLGQTSPTKRNDHVQQRQLNLVKGGGQTFDLLQKIGLDTEGVNDNYEDDEQEPAGDDKEEESEDDDQDDEDDGSSFHSVAQADSHFESAEAIAAKKAATLRSRILQYFDSRKEGRVKQEEILDFGLQKEAGLVQEDNSAEVHKKEDEVESSRRLGAEKELEHIINLLRERELSLAEVTKELEEAKAQYSLARAKATAELVHATQVAAEKEARLQEAESALSSLRQVHLEWWGEAKHVELAGTFNGWQHRILMEPDPTSEFPKPDGSRGPMMWGTHLYLYPGVYEVKFIVDGNWQLDHRREVVMRHGNQNNILRVEL